MGKFEFCNILHHDTSPERAHGGNGEIQFARLAEGGEIDGACNFIDLAILPPGVTIGLHQHSPSEEEFYLVLEGQGVLTRNSVRQQVEEGSLIRNPPAGEHSLENTGDGPLRLFVFELQVVS